MSTRFLDCSLQTTLFPITIWESSGNLWMQLLNSPPEFEEIEGNRATVSSASEGPEAISPVEAITLRLEMSYSLGNNASSGRFLMMFPTKAMH